MDSAGKYWEALETLELFRAETADDLPGCRYIFSRSEFCAVVVLVVAVILVVNVVVVKAIGRGQLDRV